jgi:hypothetical protein
MKSATSVPWSASKTAQEVLLGLAAALVLADHEPGTRRRMSAGRPSGAQLEIASRG